MALPASGTISMSQINTELRRSSTATIQLKKAEDGDYGTLNHSAEHSGGAPHSMSEWHGYQHYPSVSVQSASIVDFWDARSGNSSNWKSVYGNDTNMSVNNGTSYTSSEPAHYEFDGTNDYIVTDDTISPGSAWTIAVWVNHTGTQGGNYERIFGMDSYQFEFAETSGDKARFYDGAWSDIAGISLDQSDWQNITFTYDGSDLKIYEDGALDQTTSDGRSISGKKIYLGCQQLAGECWQGQIGKFIIWNRALTSSEVNSIYSNDKTYFD